MKDTIIKGNGTSRSIKAPANIPETFAEWRVQLLAGIATLDIGLNVDGCEVVGTALSKANLLSDNTKTALELTGDEPTVNDALYALSQKGSPAEVHVMADIGTTVTMTRNGKTLSAVVAADGFALLHPAELGEWTIASTVAGSNRTVDYTLSVIGILYVYPFEVGATLEDTTWDNIDLVGRMGKAQDYWNIGDTKTVAVNGVNYTFKIIGFDHDTLNTSIGTRTKAPITFQMANCLSTKYAMNSTNSNTGGWRDSSLRNELSVMVSQLPLSLQNVLKTVDKHSTLSIAGSNIIEQITQDKLFLLSEKEVFGTYSYSYMEDSSRYSYYANGNAIVKTVGEVAENWWERSIYKNDSQGFCRVSNDGSADFYSATSLAGVSFAFCV